MFKYCPNVDQGIAIPILELKKSGSFVTPIDRSFDNFLKLLIFSEPVHRADQLCRYRTLITWSICCHREADLRCNIRLPGLLVL